MSDLYCTTDEDDFNWKPYPICGCEITQDREAFFRCINCKQEFIDCEEDMKQ